MPQIFYKNPDKIAVSLDELIPGWFPTYHALYQKIRRDNKRSNGIYGIKRLQEGKGLGNEVLFDFDSLPREIQDALGDPRKSNHIMEKWYTWDADAFRFFGSQFTFENGTSLSDQHRDRFTLNASVLKAVHEFKEAHISELAKRDMKPRAIYLWMANECQSFQKTLKIKHQDIQHTLPPSERQFRDVYHKFFVDDNTCDYKSLIDGRLMNENALVLTLELKALLDSMFAKSGRVKPNKAKVAKRYQLFKEGKLEVIANETGELYNPESYGELSERSITRWLNQYESKAGTLILRSADRQKFNEKMKVSREMTLPTFAGTLYSIDDRQPPFEYAKGQRLWLYNGADVASGAITTTVVGKDKEGLMIEFYRQMVRNYTEWNIKLPWELEAEISLNSSFQHTFLKNGSLFQKVHLVANNARGKYIERINKELRHDLEKEYDLWKGRPFAIDESSQPMPYDNIYKKNEQFVAYESLVQQSLKVVENWNNLEHSKYPGLTRWDYFMSRQHKDLKPTNWRAILPHLGFATKSRCNVGKVALQGSKRMIADNGEILVGEALINKLKMIEGQDVTVYWLDGNDGNVLKAIAYMGDTYICELMPVPKFVRGSLEQTPQCKQKQIIQEKYISTVESFIRTRSNEISSITLVELEERTLNQNFRMPQIERRIPREDFNPEIIDTDEDESYDIPLTNTKTKLLNRF